MEREFVILVVDDDPPVAASLRRLFRRAGFDVHVAHGGREAVAKLDDLYPDVVLSDYRMPDLSGIDVLDEVHRRYPSAARGLISGSAGSECKIESLVDKTRCFFIAKPWDDTTLTKKVNKQLSDLNSKGIF